VCLKNYQAKIDTTTPCTFGSIVTVPLEGNSLNLTAKNGLSGFDNKIGFNFDFTWPVSTRNIKKRRKTCE
jgi:Golgi apparatus protein 1